MHPDNGQFPETRLARVIQRNEDTNINPIALCGQSRSAARAAFTSAPPPFIF